MIEAEIAAEAAPAETTSSPDESETPTTGSEDEVAAAVEDTGAGEAEDEARTAGTEPGAEAEIENLRDPAEVMGEMRENNPQVVEASDWDEAEAATVEAAVAQGEDEDEARKRFQEFRDWVVDAGGIWWDEGLKQSNFGTFLDNFFVSGSGYGSGGNWRSGGVGRERQSSGEVIAASQLDQAFKRGGPADLAEAIRQAYQENHLISNVNQLDLENADKYNDPDYMKQILRDFLEVIDDDQKWQQAQKGLAMFVDPRYPDRTFDDDSRTFFNYLVNHYDQYFRFDIAQAAQQQDAAAQAS